MSEQIQFYEEQPRKIWAITPKPQFETFEGVRQDIGRLSSLLSADTADLSTLSSSNYYHFLKRCVLGLAHNRELAEARLQEAIANPRLAAERLYQQSFVETSYKLGALAVVAFTAVDDSQPEEWVVEGYLGEATSPEVRTLPMSHTTVWGIDIEDQHALNGLIEEWFPN